MKIRIKGNSLRYRLTKSDVAKLGSEGFLEERSEFVGKTLVYAIETIDGDGLSADYIGDRIVLSIPKTMVDELNNTDRVGFDDRKGPVSLLIEKDFTCLDNVEEDQSDNFPNPLLNK
ncbi:DUF7009 family protein [Pedobacter panaciterrae]|jgi:hypothetical protein|uniref:Uncharacterized protein n=1 Tax=Pedobacter panaciterrae TaxID=363849 RepID=A0ABU8NMT7_9SPHI|nr:hypothetical protein [Pedobacter panaciterrae]NQX53179.1 hypothetical protein [Pedobacter panaciterrae]